METKLPNYLTKIIKRYPSILSGRKNPINHHNRIVKTKKLIKKFKSKINK